MNTLFSNVKTEDGEFMVLTKSRYLFVFNIPRSSVMPARAGEYVARPGFQVRYNTTDPAIVQEWHEMLVSMLREGMFMALRDCTRVGYFPYPEDKRHLEQHVKSFM